MQECVLSTNPFYFFEAKLFQNCCYLINDQHLSLSNLRSTGEINMQDLLTLEKFILRNSWKSYCYTCMEHGFLAFYHYAKHFNLQAVIREKNWFILLNYSGNIEVSYARYKQWNSWNVPPNSLPMHRFEKLVVLTHITKKGGNWKDISAFKNSVIWLPRCNYPSSYLFTIFCIFKNHVPWQGRFSLGYGTIFSAGICRLIIYNICTLLFKFSLCP